MNSKLILKKLIAFVLGVAIGTYVTYLIFDEVFIIYSIIGCLIVLIFANPRKKEA